jgi:hypothetical protein
MSRYRIYHGLTITEVNQMPIQRKAEPAAPQRRSTSKGFARLASDLWAEKIPVKLALRNGQVYAGMIVNYEGDVISLEVQVDRFNLETVFFPMSSVVSITTGPTQA